MKKKKKYTSIEVIFIAVRAVTGFLSYIAGICSFFAVMFMISALFFIFEKDPYQKKEMVQIGKQMILVSSLVLLVSGCLWSFYAKIASFLDMREIRKMMTVLAQERKSAEQGHCACVEKFCQDQLVRRKTQFL